MEVHQFYRRYKLRLHEIPLGVKCPVVSGWPDSQKYADDVEPLLNAWTNKYGWILDDCHFVLDVDVHNEQENGFDSLRKLERDIGMRLDSVCGAIVATPSGGRHYYFSKDPAVKFGKVFKQFYPGLDFIAGKGKQVIAANSCHDKFEGIYELRQDATLVAAPQKLIEHLQSLRPAAEHKEPTAYKSPEQERSGDEFNQSSRGLQLLIAELSCRGYVVRSVGDYYEFDRPNKSSDSKCSGHIGKRSQQGNFQLTCFSLSDDVFPTGESMAIFHAYALLCHHGNHVDAADALYARGFAPTDNSDVMLDRLIAQAASRTPDEEDEEPWESSNDPGPFPQDCLIVPGLLGEIVKHNLRTSRYPQAELALGAAMALLGTITGRKVACGDMRTNVYCLGLAPSGAGKEHGRQLNKTLLHQACADHLLGPERLGSHAGLINVVDANPAVLLQLDEISRLLATMKNPSKSPHLYNIGGVLMTMESSSNTVWIGDAYADAKKIKKIVQPHPCIYGTSVPEDFWMALSADDMKNGMVGRILLFESSQPYPDYQEPETHTVPQELVDWVRWWVEYRPGGNLNAQHPVPLQVTESPEAAERLRGHFAGIAERRKVEGPVNAALWSRSGGRAMRLSLLLAASKYTGAGGCRIELEDVDRAIRISNWMTRRILFKADDFIARNDYDAKMNDVLRCIPWNGGISQSDLTRGTRWLRKRERDEILAQLLEMGAVKIVSEKTKGREKKLYKRRSGKKG